MKDDYFLDKRYPALEAIINIQKFLAYFISIVTIIISLFLFSVNILLALVSMIICPLIIFIFFFSMAEIIKLFIDIEKNTRKENI